MGNYVIVIHGTGPHHNFVKDDDGKLVPDGNGDYQRTSEVDADYMAANLVRELRSKCHNVTSAAFTVGGTDDISKDRHVLKMEV